MRLRVLTWHVHGSYLWYLSFASGIEWVLPVDPDHPDRPGYGGRAGRDWPHTVTEVPVSRIGDPGLDVDCVLFQSTEEYRRRNDELRQLPRVFLEHDPPRQSPTDTRHPVTDPEVLVVHCTPFNRLMWDCSEVPTTVIDHGVAPPAGVSYTGEIERGLVVVNNLARRGRRLGLDVFRDVRGRVPLDVVGMGSEEVGGLGEVPPAEMAAFAARYRFLFNPIRYTSLGLAVLEAMAVGVPVVGLATTEMATAVENGVSGFVDTDVGVLEDRMRSLLEDPALARRLGEGARRRAAERFGIGRFAREWEETLRRHAAGHPARSVSSTTGVSRA